MLSKDGQGQMQEFLKSLLLRKHSAELMAHKSQEQHITRHAAQRTRSPLMGKASSGPQVITSLNNQLLFIRLDFLRAHILIPSH